MRGGSAIIMKDILHHEEIEYETREIQATAVSVNIGHEQTTLVATYCPPRYLFKMNQYLNFLSNQENEFIIGGDFNAENTHWGSRLTTIKSKELSEAMKEYKCEALSTGKPTYWPTDPDKIPDLIGFFIIKDISARFLQIEERLDMNSDHSPITLIFSENIIKKGNIPKLTNKLTD